MLRAHHCTAALWWVLVGGDLAYTPLHSDRDVAADAGRKPVADAVGDSEEESAGEAVGDAVGEPV